MEATELENIDNNGTEDVNGDDDSKDDESDYDNDECDLEKMRSDLKVLLEKKRFGRYI